MPTHGPQALGKVPELTLLFWVLKIAATTLGETAGDMVSMSLGWGYVVGSAIFAAVFVFAVACQIHARQFHPWLYWWVIIATTTVGTTLADYFDRSLGIGYLGGASTLLVLLLACLALWYALLGSVAVERIATPRAEAFYWTTILFSQTLGTALGDWVADADAGLGLGYDGGAVLFGLGLFAVVALYLFTRCARALLFWLAFVLTRPLGATLGDYLDKPLENGGLDLSRYSASAALLVFIVVCVLLFPQRAAKLAANN